MSFAKFFKDALLSVAVWTCGVLLSCFVLTFAGAPVSNMRKPLSIGMFV